MITGDPIFSFSFKDGFQVGLLFLVNLISMIPRSDLRLTKRDGKKRSSERRNNK